MSRNVRFLVCGLPAILMGVAAFQAGLMDDAYIFCRYAENLISGLGAVFNPDERVEGYTSPLHMLLIAAGAATGVPAWQMARALPLFAAVATIWLVGFVKTRSDDSPLVGPIAAVLTAASMPFALWATTGMDTSLFALAVTAAVLALERSAPGQVSAPVWLLAGATFLVRPEGAVVLAAAAALAWRPRQGLSVAAGLVPIAALTLFRLAYYGVPLPNTFYAKVDGGGLALFGRGLLYVLDALIRLLPLAAVAAVAAWRYRQRSFAMVIALGLMGAAVFEGGDHFSMHRFFVPVIPLLALVAAREITSRTATAGQALAVGLGLALVLGPWTMFAPSLPDGSGQSMRRRFRGEISQSMLFDEVGQQLAAALGPDHDAAMLTVGAIPYRTRWKVIDLLGLTDGNIARTTKALGHGTAGHEKFDSAYVLGRRPELILLYPWFWSSPVADDKVRTIPFLHEAQKDLLRSPRFEREYRLQWVKLPGGFVALYRRV